MKMTIFRRIYCNVKLNLKQSKSFHMKIEHHYIKYLHRKTLEVSLKFFFFHDAGKTSHMLDRCSPFNYMNEPLKNLHVGTALKYKNMEFSFPKCFYIFEGRQIPKPTKTLIFFVLFMYYVTNKNVWPKNLSFINIFCIMNMAKIFF